MRWQLRRRGMELNMSLDIMFIFPYIHETGTGLDKHIGYGSFEWEYDIGIPSFMTLGDDSSIMFSKSEKW